MIYILQAKFFFADKDYFLLNLKFKKKLQNILDNGCVGCVSTGYM